MKIINIETNHIFDLPKVEAENLLKTYPETFAKVAKNKKIIRSKKAETVENNILKQITDE